MEVCVAAVQNHNQVDQVVWLDISLKISDVILATFIYKTHMHTCKHILLIKAGSKLV